MTSKCNYKFFTTTTAPGSFTLLIFFVLHELHCSGSEEVYTNLLHRLGSELILQLMVQLLTERKLLFVSVMPDILVDTIQQLITVRWM